MTHSVRFFGLAILVTATIALVKPDASASATKSATKTDAKARQSQLWPQRAYPLATSQTKEGEALPGTCKTEGTGGKCKDLGGTLGGCCSRCGEPSIQIAPNPVVANVGVPVTVYFTPRGIGTGDYVIYAFGRVNWGDTVENLPVSNGVTVPMVHTFHTKGLFTVYVSAGAQFKYSGKGSCSYECCTDLSVNVTVR
jgi:hypothetical protein